MSRDQGKGGISGKKEREREGKDNVRKVRKSGINDRLSSGGILVL